MRNSHIFYRWYLLLPSIVHMHSSIITEEARPQVISSSVKNVKNMKNINRLIFPGSRVKRPPNLGRKRCNFREKCSTLVQRFPSPSRLLMAWHHLILRFLSSGTLCIVIPFFVRITVASHNAAIYAWHCKVETLIPCNCHLSPLLRPPGSLGGHNKKET